MPSFFNRGNTSHRGELLAEDASKIKTRIKERLSEAIKELQTHYGRVHEDIIPSNRVSSTVLAAIEAIFIHGLKDSLLGKISFALGPGERSNSVPEPSFWLYLLIFSHREEIDKVNSLSQISTDVGRCRAWLRIVINAGLLSSYLQSMSKDRASCRSHYHFHAFIRDPEALDIAMQLINGLEVFTFDMATNSSILNKWQSTPLAIAGLVEEATIGVALDASSMILDEEEDSHGGGMTNGGISQSRPSEPLNTEKEKSSIRPVEKSIMRGLLNEEEALRLILQSSTPISGSPVASSALRSSLVHASNLSPPSSLHHRSISSLPSMTDIKTSMSPPTADFMTPPNSFLQSSSLSSMKSDNPSREKLRDADSDFVEEVEEGSATTKSPQDSSSEETNSCVSSQDILDKDDLHYGEDDQLGEISSACSDKKSPDKSDVMTNSDLASRKCSNATRGNSTKSEEKERWKVPRLSGFVDAWDPFGRRNYFDKPLDIHEVINYGFSAKPNIHIGGLSQVESQFFMSCFDIVTKEQGLDDQNWECFDCNKAIGTVFGPYKTCAYTKKYFCTDCHVDDMRYIPYKVVFNWEFTKYPVSKKAKIFLDAIKSEPIINVESFNCGLFAYSSDLDAIFTLRKKVSYQYQYLKVCTLNPNAYFHIEKQVESRSYLIDDVDTYSMLDMEQTFLGSLPTLLKSLDKYAKAHILSCLICKGHGFICEICRNEKPLYPFELEKISQCEKCFTVFHKECAVSLITCPKCERIESRNLNWHVSNVRIKKSSSSNLNNSVIGSTSSLE